MKRFIVILMSAICFFAGFGTISQATSKELTPDNNQDGDLGITIDGNFDDWADKSKQRMIKGSNNDDFNIKYAPLLTDSKNIYFYILMHPVGSGGGYDTGYYQIQPSGYKLKVGPKVFDLTINPSDNPNRKDIDHLKIGQKMPVSLDIWSASDSYNQVLDGLVYVKRQYIDQKMGDGTPIKGSGYVVEAKIPFKNLKGISNTSGQTIKLANGNLWDGDVEAAGGSTGPVILASSGFLIALGAVLKYSGFSFKKRRHA